MYLLGSHVGMSGKDMMLGSVKTALSYGANTFMLYTGAPQNTRRKKIEELNIPAARELIKENGWAAVSIRSVAAKCSVSAGTIYNYYESKAELLGATIESVWQEIFFHPEDEQVFHDVTTCISWIYERFQYGNKRFPGFFSLHSFGFMKEGKDDGKKRMMRTWGHILNGLCEVLKNDHKIRPDVFDENFTEMQFAEILFSLMLVSVIREDYDPSSVLMLINKTLY